MKGSIGLSARFMGLVFLTGFSGAIGAQEARFVYVAEKLPSASSDYQGVGLADGSQDVYLYLSRQSAQGLMVRWIKEKESSRSIEVPMPEVSSPGGETGIAWADIDGDGDLDLYIGRYGKVNLLYVRGQTRNGLAQFTEQSESRGLDDWGPGQAVAWADYDLDGDLDVHVTNFGEPNVLYRNDGDGQGFTAMTDEAVAAESAQSTNGVWVDYDSDGDLDLYVVNHKQPNRLFMRDEGGFTEVASRHGLDDDGPGVGCSWVDYDSDGDWDLSLAQYDRPNALYNNPGPGVEKIFQDVAPRQGLDDRGQGQMMAWGDYDRDGRQDVFVVNGGDDSVDLSRLYHNDGERFGNATAKTGLMGRKGGGAKRGKGAIWWDMDDDGDLDLLVVNKGSGTGIYRNDGLGDGNNWLKISMFADGQQNVMGVGSLLRIWSEGRSQIRQVGVATSYLSQGSFETFVGLGKGTVDRVEVTWPDGYQPEPLLARENGPLEIYRRGAELVINPTEMDFGEASVGASRWHDLVLTNEGEADLRIESLRATFPGGPEREQAFFMTGFGAGEEGAIAPGDTLTADVEFRPRASRDYEATLQIQSGEQSQTISLKGKGGERGELVIEPGKRMVKIDWRDREAKLTLKNTGTEPIRIQSAEIRNYSVDGVRDYVESEFKTKIDGRTVTGESSSTVTVIATPQAHAKKVVLKVKYQISNEAGSRYAKQYLELVARVRARDRAAGGGEIDWSGLRRPGSALATGVGIVGWWVANGKVSDWQRKYEKSAFSVDAERYWKKGEDARSSRNFWLNYVTLPAAIWLGYEMRRHLPGFAKSIRPSLTPGDGRQPTTFSIILDVGIE